MMKKMMNSLLTKHG